MQLSTHFGELPFRKYLAKYAQERLGTMADHLISQVREIRLRVQDVNGPERGGKDKRGKIVAVLANQRTVVVEDEDASAGALINRLVDRLELTLYRRLGRSQSRRVHKGLPPVEG